MQVFTCNNFSGHYPVGTSAVIVAADAAQAKAMLLEKLAATGLPQGPADAANIEIVRVATRTASVTILQDGNY